MRIYAEHLPKTNRLLVRLLAQTNDSDQVVSGVQIGTYILDGRPHLSSLIEFEVESEQIIKNETKLYFTGYTTLPEELLITLPDATVHKIVVGQVQVTPPPPILDEQPTDVVTPVEKPPKQEPDSKPDVISPPEIPSLWFEMNFSSSNPLKIGKGLEYEDFSYVGGGTGRALTNNVTQQEANQRPWYVGGFTYLEGGFTNTLPRSDFSQTYHAGLFDPVPLGWELIQTDSLGLVRTNINKQNTVLPNWEIIYYLRSDYYQNLTLPPITIKTPEVAANETFQVIVETSKRNLSGQLRLVSATGKYMTPKLTLNLGTRQSIKLNVQDDPGSVKIQWFQQGENGDEQRLTLLAPMSSAYEDLHTYAPHNVEVASDSVKISKLLGKWFFGSGQVRLESSLEDPTKPLSWSVTDEAGRHFLKVEQGILSSSFSTKTIDIRDYTNTNALRVGNYRLRWKPNQNFKFVIKDPDVPEQETVLDFAFDLPFPEDFLTSPLDVELKSYSPTSGSGRIHYMSFVP